MTKYNVVMCCYDKILQLQITYAGTITRILS